MLYANEVREPAHGASRAEKVTELRRTVDGGGIENNVVMYVLPVRVGANNVGVLALEEALGQLAPYDVCFLRRNLTRLERLAYVVGNHARSLAPSVLRVLTF